MAEPFNTNQEGNQEMDDDKITLKTITEVADMIYELKFRNIPFAVEVEVNEDAVPEWERRSYVFTLGPIN
tara:strand:+ start:770 stop:979 length:210 start_codon:yes stop_codon:yes gene_type:complete